MAHSAHIGITASSAIERALGLASRGGRRLLGIAGAPGAGKTTLARALAGRVAEAGVDVSTVPMDGFHLANQELERLGRGDRKGAPDTFDAHGFVALIGRLHRADEPVVYAPAFDHGRNEPIAGAIAVPATISLVIIEGNYLLLDGDPWARIRDLLDEAWYVDLDEESRRRRLIARHTAHGKTPADAIAWALGPDERNAEVIRMSRDRADYVVDPEH